MKTCTSCGKEWPDEFKLCPADGSSLRSASSPEDLVDTVIADRYLILKKLGQGGMGTVYLGEHVKMGQRAAIKVISRHLASDPAAIARFNREARNAAQIKHPNVCMVHDFGETPEGLIYMAMEFIEGEALADILHRDGRMTLQRASDILMQCCDALQSAHDLDIVHRDIKPENIMMTTGRDGSDVVKVVDFGIAKAVASESGQTVTQTGFIVGTPDYMSPDQVSGEVLDGRSDIYSLAVVFYRMVTGALPFKTETPHDALMARLAGKPISLAEALPTAGFPEGLQQVLDKALAQKRTDRYDTALDFGRAVQGAVQDAVGGAPTTIDSAVTYKLPTPQPLARPSAPTTPDTPQPRPSQAPRKKRTPLVAAAVVVVLAGGSVAVWQMAGPDGAPVPAATDTTAAADSTPATPPVATTDSTPATAAVAETPAAETPAVATTGTVIISDLPRGGTILAQGRTQRSPLTLPAGRHQIELRAPGFENKRVTVDVVAGERMTIIYAARPLAPAETTPVAEETRAQPRARAIAVGRTENSALTASDQQVGGRHVQPWTLRGAAGQRVEITLRSDAFDTYLYFRGPGIAQALEDDDGGDGLNSRLTVTLPQSGSYTILATTLGQGLTGPYSLSVTEVADAQPPTSGGTLRLGQTVRGAIAAQADRFDGRPVQAWSFSVPPRTDVEITMRADFDTYLFLTGPGLPQPLTNDDGGDGSNARIVANLAQGGTYTVLASAYSPSATGEYSLTAAAPVTLATLRAMPGRPLGVGGAVQGNLTNSDQRFDSRRVKVYELRARAGTRVTITLESDAFDTYLYFAGPGLSQMTNDDAGGGTNSQIVVTLPEDGTYRVGVAGFRESSVGAFRLSVR